MKTVFLLIGPKGSGKTYIGNLVEQNLNIKFLNVEPFFINEIKKEDDSNEAKFKKVWSKIESEIDNILSTQKSVIFESIGTFKSFKDFLKRLRTKYKIKLIKIYSPLEQCNKRMIKRNADAQVYMSKKNIALVNKMSLKENYKYDLVINNENNSDDNIVSKFNTII